MKYILFSILLLAGCDSVVSTEKLGEPVVKEEVVSCHHLSYCFTCGPGFDGKMNCNAKMSPMCPGNQLALVEHQEIRYQYESGKTMVHNSTTVVKELETCH